MQRFAAAVLFLALSTGGWAQIAENSGAPVTLTPPRAAVPPSPSAVAFMVPQRPKAFDRGFGVWMAASFAATAADIESTAHGISSCGAVELNPLFGSRPSRARMYGVGMPITAGYDLLALWAKRRRPNSRLWMLLPGSMTALHAGAAAHNLALCH